MERKSNEFKPIISTKFHDIWNLRTITFSRYQSKRFVFTIRTSEYSAKVFQVFFNQKDGSLNVNFPYIPTSSGIASICSLSPFAAKQEIHLEEKGKLTTKKVKYAHKPDGRVHFSQDGKVKTEIIKQSVPLVEQDGHIFTLYIQGLSEFKQVAPNKDTVELSPNKTVLNFEFLDPTHRAYKIVGWWHKIDGFIQRSRGTDFGPKVNIQDKSGVKQEGFLLGNLIGKPFENYTLLVTCESHEILDKDRDFLFIFIGGFDHPQSPIVTYARTEFLVIQYPVSNYEELASKIASIDFDPNQKLIS